MRITKNSLVTMSYSMHRGDGELIDEAFPEEHFEFQCGSGQLVPGFERALMGLRAGERKDFVVSAAEAYGERCDELVKRVPRRSLPDDIEVQEGMRIPLRSPEGVGLVCRILSVHSDSVVADFNHPLAGMELRCSVNVLAVKNAN